MLCTGYLTQCEFEAHDSDKGPDEPKMTCYTPLHPKPSLNPELKP